MLQAHGRVHPATGRRRQAAARDARLLRHACSTACARWALHDVFDSLQARSPAIRTTAAASNGWAALGPRRGALHPGAGLPPARAGLAAPLRRASSAWRPWRGCAGFSPAGDGPAQPSGRRLRVRQDAARTAATVGARAGAHGRAAGERPAARERPHLPHRLVARTPRARPPASSPSSRPRAATPSSSARCSPTTRPRACRAGELAGKSRAAAGHPDRRRRERRRDDERVSAQVPRGDARGRGQRRAAAERHRVPGAPVRARHPRGRLAGDPADLPRSDLGAHAARRRGRATGTRHRGAEARRQPLPHGRRQLDQQHLLGPGLRERPRPDGGSQRPLPREGHPPALPTANPAIATPCSTCWLPDQLLSLLGPGPLDRLRPGDLPPRRGTS